MKRIFLVLSLLCLILVTGFCFLIWNGFAQAVYKVEDTLEVEIKYTCPHCQYIGETTTPYKRKKYMGVDAIVFKCDNCGEKIAITKKMKKAQIEAFIHGAMCSSISGRCYLSQTLSGSQKQSANRGKCTQPCRREWKLIAPDSHEFIYDGQRIFNSRDLCMINYIPELIQSGIKSFKIEGRMRHPHYVETVSRVYREAIDSYYNGEFEKKLKKEKWITQLKRVYNRGFTTGFYFQQATIKDSQLNSPANVSHFRYIEMGRILTYHPTGVAKIELFNGTLKIGDKLIVMSTDGNYETYFNQKIKDIRVNGKDVEFTGRATKEKPIIITISVDHPVNGKKIDAIYKFTDETYSKPKKGGKKRKTSYKLS